MTFHREKVQEQGRDNAGSNVQGREARVGTRFWRVSIKGSAGPRGKSEEPRAEPGRGHAPRESGKMPVISKKDGRTKETNRWTPIKGDYREKRLKTAHTEKKKRSLNHSTGESPPAHPTTL